MADQLELKPPLYSRERDAKPSIFCVTGCSGYVAAPIVQRLLAGGHTVRGTVRSLSSKPAQELQALPGAAERLKLFVADLLEEGSFDEAVSGAEYVLHTASPFAMQVPKGKTAQEALLTPALKGTENVLGACTRSGSVRRVVLTSSVAAVACDPTEHGQGHVLSDKDWATSSSESCMPYFYSKKLAEQRAWELAGQQGDKGKAWELVAVLPALVMGPPALDRADGESVKIATDMATGKMPLVPHSGMGICDVRDVASAQVLAALTPGASGRYIICTGSYWFKQIAETMRAGYPQGLKLPAMVAPSWLLRLLAPLLGLPSDFVKTSLGKKPEYDASRAPADLGIEYRPLQETVCDMLAALMDRGIVPRATPAAGGAGQK